MPATAAITVTYNGRHYLERCLPALLSQTQPFAEVLVVDNGSSDGTQSWLERAYPDVSVLGLKSNAGFSAGVNSGLKAILADSRFDYVALINNDVYLEKEWHAESLRVLQSSPEIGSCATCLIQESKPGIMDSGGIIWARPGLAENYLNGQPAPAADMANQAVSGACAAAALYRSILFRDIGLFDENLFSYQEDVDLALRAQTAGWRCLFAPNARGVHTGHGSNRAFPIGGSWADYYNARNRLAVLVASLPADQWQKHWRAILAGESKLLLSSLYERRATAVLAGFARGLFRLPGILFQRRKQQRRVDE